MNQPKNSESIYGLEDLIEDLYRVDQQMADLKRLKEDLEQEVIKLTNRGEFNDGGELLKISQEGCEQIVVGAYKVKITTNYNYAINKEEYDAVSSQLAPEFNPVKTIVKYEVNKSIIRNIQKYGSEKENQLVQKFVEFKFSKPSVTIQFNV